MMLYAMPLLLFDFAIIRLMPERRLMACYGLQLIRLMFYAFCHAAITLDAPPR